MSVWSISEASPVEKQRTNYLRKGRLDIPQQKKKEEGAVIEILSERSVELLKLNRVSAVGQV